VRDGWVASSPNPDDGRSRIVALTDKATGVLPAVFQFAAAVSAEATACFTPEEARTFELLLSRLCEHGAADPSKGGGR